MMERIDLMDVKQFCLIIRGLEDWMNEELELVKDHFKAEANGEIVQSVVVEDETAVIKFARPKGILSWPYAGGYVGDTSPPPLQIKFKQY